LRIRSDDIAKASTRTSEGELSVFLPWSRLRAAAPSPHGAPVSGRTDDRLSYPRSLAMARQDGPVHAEPRPGGGYRWRGPDSVIRGRQCSGKADRLARYAAPCWNTSESAIPCAAPGQGQGAPRVLRSPSHS